MAAIATLRALDIAVLAKRKRKQTPGAKNRCPSWVSRSSFRGALDVHATAINEEMKVAATKALAKLAKEDVPDSVCRIYNVERLKFGPDYIIPKPFDPRVLVWEASAVAQAAMDSWVAQEPVEIKQYREELQRRAQEVAAREPARQRALEVAAD